MRSMQRVMTALVGVTFIVALPLSALAKDHGRNFESRGNYQAFKHAAENRAPSSFSGSRFSRSTAFATPPFRAARGNAMPLRYTPPVTNWAARNNAFNSNYWNRPAAAPVAAYYPAAPAYYPANNYGGGYGSNYGYAPNYGAYAAPVAPYAAGYPGAYAYGNGCSSYKAERKTANLDHLLNEKGNLRAQIAQSNANRNYNRSHRLNTQLEYVNELIGRHNGNGCAAENLGALSRGLPYNANYGYNNGAGYNGYGYNNGYAGSPMTSMVAPLLQGFIR